MENFFVNSIAQAELADKERGFVRHCGLDCLERSESAVFEELVDGLRRGRSLDLETGNGDFAGLASRLGFEAVGIDLGEEVVSEARARNPEAVFRVMDARHLPHRWKNCFDLVTIMTCCLSDFDDEEKERVVAGAATVLRGGGSLVVSDWNKCGGKLNCPKTGFDWKRCGCANEVACLLGGDFEIRKRAMHSGNKKFTIVAEKW